ncbi:MAG TPA: cupin domain-containing protein [Caulobacteraceae bacterium]|nr:cupin domain-containing protein [Caulobacteraceae bacterium]
MSRTGRLRHLCESGALRVEALADIISISGSDLGEDDMADADWLFPLKDVEAKLPPGPGSLRFRYALRRGTMKLGLYAPAGSDDQTPHGQDELYFVISGTGFFLKNGERRAFAPQDAIFVEAGAEHRFVDFSPDFAAWVVFWGPEGGEG